MCCKNKDSILRPQRGTFGGFTLIELLVVIAIIGILSSVVLASLNSARKKGDDAAVKSQMASMIAQAELYYGDQEIPSYGEATDCGGGMFGDFGANGLGKLIKGTQDRAKDGGEGVFCNSGIDSGSDYWAVVAALKGGGGFCVDNTGVSKVLTDTQIIPSTSCPD